MFALHNFLAVTCIRKLLPISREPRAIRYRTMGRDGFNKALFDCPISSSLLHLTRSGQLLICIRPLLSLFSLFRIPHRCLLSLHTHSTFYCSLYIAPPIKIYAKYPHFYRKFSLRIPPQHRTNMLISLTFIALPWLYIHIH